MYTYALVEVRRVIDGDTVDLVLDLGFHIRVTDRFRLNGIDTPELNDKDPVLRDRAQAAKKFTADWLTNSGPYLVETYKTDSFGRWLADVWNSQGQRITVALLQAGLAVPFKRTGAQLDEKAP